MEVHLFLRTFCVIVLVCTFTIVNCNGQGADSEAEFPSLLMDSLDKRASFKKLRSHNPILIYHQSIQQPRYLPRISSLRDEPARGYDIPRRLIRRGSNKTHSNIAPLLVWNHQLLPNFYNKRQPPFFMSLRRDGYNNGNLKNNPTVKRSDYRWLQPAKPYEDEPGKDFAYEDIQSPQDDYDDEESDNVEFGRLRTAAVENGNI